MDLADLMCFGSYTVDLVGAVCGDTGIQISIIFLAA